MSHAARAILRAEYRLFRREPGALFWILGFPTALVVILGFVPSFQDRVEQFGGQSVLALYVSVAVLLSIIFASIQALPTVLAGYREQQILRRFAATPVRPLQLLFAQYVLHAAAVVLGALLVIAVGRLGYGIALPANPAAYALVLLLALGACLALGGFIAGIVPSARLATAIGTVLMFPLMFTAGTWIPVQAMPPVLARVIEWTPLGAAARGLDAAALGNWPAPLHLAIIGGWMVVFAVLAARYFRWE